MNKKKVLIFTDSRGQHIPAGSSHKSFAQRITEDIRFDVDLYLCPMKWTTTLDFIELTQEKDLKLYDHVILYTGIVDWSPRPQQSAINDLYNNINIANLENIQANTNNYSKKIVNNKQKIFNQVFDGTSISRYLNSPFDCIYENQPTINMYSLEMAKDSLLPLLKKIPNLIFISANKIVNGWDGDFKRTRPSNIFITHNYSKLFVDELSQTAKIIDLMAWTDDDIKKFTCDNMHLTEYGMNYIYDKLLAAMEMDSIQNLVIDNIKESDNVKNLFNLKSGFAGLETPEKFNNASRVKVLSYVGSPKYLATLVISIRVKKDDVERIRNFEFLLNWLEHFYGDLFDILVIEQGLEPKLKTMTFQKNTRYEFIYNPYEYNRGWGYNVAVKHFCHNSKIVVFMDTDVLTGKNFVREVLDCYTLYDAVSPYQNIYYTDESDAQKVMLSSKIDFLVDATKIKNPVTISGGILIIKKAVFMEVNGFEQYVGYGCEDRALDVTLLSYCDNSKLRVAPFTYVHLFHKSDVTEKKNFKLIYNHLVSNYGCKYDPNLTPFDYIHKSCEHSLDALVRLLVETRLNDFGAIDLFKNSSLNIAINGQVKSRDLIKENYYLPDINIAIRNKDLLRSLKLCQFAQEHYIDNSAMLKILNSKISEIEKSAMLLNDCSESSLPIIQSKTLIILGNGPSLKHVMGNAAYRDILKQYDTFGLNAAYRAYDELNFWPTYLGCLDMIVVESHLRSYEKIVGKFKKMFLLAEDHQKNSIVDFEHPNLVRIRFDELYRDSNDKILSERFDKFRNWQNSGCNCVQIGLMLGYERVILLGMDANYKEVLNEATIIRDDKYKWDHLQITAAVENNENYWFSGYQQDGDKYNIPNAAKYHLPAWNALGQSEHRNKIINCSTETKISTIRRQSFEETVNFAPQYNYPKGTIFLQAVNFAFTRLLFTIVRHNDILYIIDQDGNNLVRRIIMPEILDTYTDQALLPLEIIDVSAQILDLPCHGLAKKLPSNKNLRPGLTFLIRARDECANIYFVLGSLKHILNNEKLNCEVVFIDNLSSDGTYNEVLRICMEHSIMNVMVTKYDVEVSPSGDAHTKLKELGEMPRSLDNYYNWCLARVFTYNVVKWDSDFLAIEKNLIQFINKYSLHDSNTNLAIWFSGKTLFKTGNEFFINEQTMYNEFRVFSKLHGYSWEYAPRWEICSQSYMIDALKSTYSPAVFLELKDLGKNEFAFRSAGSAIRTDIRDTRDANIIDLIQSGQLENTDLKYMKKLQFNPLLPINYTNQSLQEFECTLEELAAMQSYWINVYSRLQNLQRFAYSGNIIVQGLWVGKEITDIHKMCISSFIKNGHCFVLYTYNEVGNLPDGVVTMDANKIIPATMIYEHDGSYAGFSDLFRNKLLYQNGGWYVDLDIFCLKPYDIEQEIVFSLDHYHDSTVIAKRGTNQIIDDKYYVQTNPCKLPARHDIARSMYAFILKKVIFSKMQAMWLGSNLKDKLNKEKIQQFVQALGVTSDFEEFIIKWIELPEKISFHELLELANLSLNQVGQKTWGEIGPILVTTEIVDRGLERFTTKPEMFQGIIKYFEIEKFIDPDFDFISELEKHDPYSIDFFFTMWRRRNILDKREDVPNTFYKYLAEMVSN